MALARRFKDPVGVCAAALRYSSLATLAGGGLLRCALLWLCLMPLLGSPRVLGDGRNEKARNEKRASWRPRSISTHAGPNEDWKLTLAEARRIALANNKEIGYVRYEPVAAAAVVQQEDSVFDPAFEMGALWESDDIEVANAIQSFGAISTEIHNKMFTYGENMPDTLALKKRLRTGGDIRLSYGCDEEYVDPEGLFVIVNPGWYSRLNVELKHNLCRGFGLPINEARICIARADCRRSRDEFFTIVQQQIRDVEFAYWQLYYTFRDLKAQESAARRAEETWKNEKYRLKVGEGTAPDVAQAKVQMERYRIAGVEAQARRELAENRLRYVMGIPISDRYRIEPVDRPMDLHWPADFDAAVEEALARRPEILAVRAEIRAAEIELYEARDLMKPDVKFVGRYSIVGLDDQWDQSIRKVTENRWSEWTLGFVLEQQIGRRDAISKTREARAKLCAARAKLAKIRLDVIEGLASAYEELEARFEALKYYRLRAEASAEELYGRRIFYELGEANVDIFLRTQIDYTQAITDQDLGHIRYAQAIARWEYAKGSIMQWGHVAILERLPPTKGKKSSGKKADGADAADPSELDKKTLRKLERLQRLPEVD